MGKGCISIQTKQGDNKKIQYVYYVTCLKHNIIRVGSMFGHLNLLYVSDLVNIALEQITVSLDLSLESY
jgi:hypothetical protein